MGKKNTYIKINGKNILTIDDLGWYIVIISHYTMKVEKIRYFNTHRSTRESTNMYNLLAHLPLRTIVLGVGYGDVGKSMTEQTNHRVNILTGKSVSAFTNTARLFVGYQKSRDPSKNLQADKQERWKPGGAFVEHRFYVNQYLRYNAYNLDFKSEGCNLNRYGCYSLDSYIHIFSTTTYIGIMLVEPGMNLMVLHPISGHVLDAKIFKTGYDFRASNVMIKWLSKIRPSRYVIGVSSGQYQQFLTKEAKMALAKITREPVINLYDSEWAFLGYTGDFEVMPNVTISLDTKKVGAPRISMLLSYSIGFYQHGRGCFLPPIPANGKRIFNKKEYLVNDIVKLVCNDKYYVVGATEAICQADHEYKYRGNATECRLDINECETGVHNCMANSFCTNTPGSFNCTCNKGYLQTGSACLDVNECKSPSTYSCPTHSVCVNTPGAYQCNCIPGFKKKNGLCDDINECEVSQVCPTNSTCINEVGKYHCVCNKGFTKNGNGCQDIDECADKALHTCQPRSYCVNELGGYRCDCNRGYQLNGKQCVDVNECLDPSLYSCHANSHCVNKHGNYVCKCDRGYKEFGLVCKDVNECADANLFSCPSDSHCVNEPGAYSCKCNKGYKKDNGLCIEHYLLDVDECIDETLYTCKPLSHCVNRVGGYTCMCNRGYKEEHGKCVDINECLDQSLHTCKAGRHCQNRPGKYVCVCNQGYEEIGSVCTDVNECLDASLYTCQNNSRCVNREGGYSCLCNPGYKDQNGICVDVNECDSPGLYHCQKHSSCVNIVGSYKCVCGLDFKEENGVCIKLSGCKKGFIRNSENACVDIDECAHTDVYSCPRGSKCKNTLGSYSCICEKGYTIKDGICADLNECTVGKFVCKKDEVCRNTVGSYTCGKCGTGYLVNKKGSGCLDVDECQLGLFNCTASYKCFNTPGSYTCECGTGFTEAKNGCRDINECLEVKKACPGNSICTNFNGGYNCSCKAGFTMLNGLCIDINSEAHLPIAPKKMKPEKVLIISSIIGVLLFLILVAFGLAFKKMKISGDKRAQTSSSARAKKQEYSEVATYGIEPDTFEDNDSLDDVSEDEDGREIDEEVNEELMGKYKEDTVVQVEENK
eukprot:gene17698-19466_t